MKQVIKIVTVDPKARRVEGVLKDGAIIQVSINRVPSTFRWPVEGEFWSVTRDNSFWYLGERHETDETTFKIEDLKPGEAKIAADKIFTESGDEVVAVVGADEDRGNNTVPAWDATEEKWKAVPGGSVVTPDKNFVWSQGVATQWWGTPIGDPSATVKHNLDKRPSVHVVDSAGTEIECEITWVNNNEVRLNFEASFSGAAYFN